MPTFATNISSCFVALQIKSGKESGDLRRCSRRRPGYDSNYLLEVRTSGRKRGESITISIDLFCRVFERFRYNAVKQ